MEIKELELSDIDRGIVVLYLSGMSEISICKRLGLSEEYVSGVLGSEVVRGYIEGKRIESLSNGISYIERLEELRYMAIEYMREVMMGGDDSRKMQVIKVMKDIGILRLREIVGRGMR